MAEPLGWVDVEHDGELRIAHIFGEVDISNIEDIKKALEDEDDGRPLVIDLTNTRYFDSAGIRALFELVGRVQPRRQAIHVVAPKEGAVRKLLELADLQSLAPILDSLDAVPRG